MVNKGASDLGLTRIHAAHDVHSIGRQETLGLRCALSSRRARTLALRSAVESLADRSYVAALRIYDSASGSY